MNIFQKDKEHFKTQYEQKLSIDAGCSTFSSASSACHSENSVPET